MASRRRRKPERYVVTQIRSKGVYAIRYTRDGGRTWRQESLEIEATDRNRTRAARAASERAAELFVRTGDDISWEDFCDRYESVHLLSLSPGSLETWRTVKNSLNATLAPQFLCDIDGDSIDVWASRMRRQKLKEPTIASRLATLRAALSYAQRIKWIDTVPSMPETHRAKGVDRKARSRPIVGEEFDRMLANVEAGLLALEQEKKRPPRKRSFSPEAKERFRAAQVERVQLVAPMWRRFLMALYLSGLRLGEACKLSWDWGADFAIDTSQKHPQYRIKVIGHKGARDVLCPMAPEFWNYLEPTPPNQRKGSVFRMGCTANHAGRVISAIGKKAKIVVNTDGKTASAQDLRRTFATRWAVRVQPAVLKELMRHRQISTTMEYYVDIDGSTIAAELWRHVDVKLSDQKSDQDLTSHGV